MLYSTVYTPSSPHMSHDTPEPYSTQVTHTAAVVRCSSHPTCATLGNARSRSRVARTQTHPPTPHPSVSRTTRARTRALSISTHTPRQHGHGALRLGPCESHSARHPTRRRSCACAPNNSEKRLHSTSQSTVGELECVWHAKSTGTGSELRREVPPGRHELVGRIVGG